LRIAPDFSSLSAIPSLNLGQYVSQYVVATVAIGTAPGGFQFREQLARNAVDDVFHARGEEIDVFLDMVGDDAKAQIYIIVAYELLLPMKR
jgi:hypothetical protein